MSRGTHINTKTHVWRLSKYAFYHAAFLSVAFLFAGVFAFDAHAQTPPMAEAVRTEALKSNNDPGGRPLPFVSVWHPFSCYQFNPSQWQLDLIEQDGYPIMPWLAASRSTSDAQVQSQYGSFLTTLRTWNMPFTLLYGTHWEYDWLSPVYDYVSGPIESTGLGQNLDGTRMSKLSPLSPVQAWYDLGRETVVASSAAAYQSLYPNPPLVMFTSNNEMGKLKPFEAGTEKRFVDLYGADASSTLKQDVFFNGYAERYSALFNGMRDNLAEPAWQSGARFHGYNAFAPDHYGRWYGWQSEYHGTDNRLQWEPLAWDGAIPESYDNNWEPAKTAFRLWSMQSEMMNMEFAKEAAWSDNPEFWYSTIFWDGETWMRDNSKSAQYDTNTDGYTPALYKGWMRYITWLNTPRHLWQFVGYAQGDTDDDGLCTGTDFVKGTSSVDVWYPYFEPLLEIAKEVYDDNTLQRFWREGDLVKNTDVRHPFQFSLLEPWNDVDRWYHLSTNLDPALPVDFATGGVGTWDHNPVFPVWTLARVIGEAPNREWLIYSHAPTGAKNGVEIKIPGYCTVSMDVPVEGAFLYVQEGAGACLDAVTSAGLRLHYSFDDVAVSNEGEEITDHSGNGFHGDWYQPLGTVVEGVRGTAIYPTNPGGGGGSDNIIVKESVRNPFDIENALAAGGSISYWIKSTPQAKPYGNIVDSSGGPSGYKVYGYGYYPQLHLKSEDVSTNLYGTRVPEDGEWHHVVHVLETDLTHSYYLDGVLVDTRGTATGFPVADSYGLRVALGPDSPLDELRIYDYPLTSGEVQSLYNEIMSPAATLTADFNQDSTVDIFDYNLLLTHFGTTGSCGVQGDADSDCDVDIFDYNALLTQFGQSG